MIAAVVVCILPVLLIYIWHNQLHFLPHKFFVAVVVFVVFLKTVLKLKHVFCNLSIFRYYYVLCIVRKLLCPFYMCLHEYGAFIRRQSLKLRNQKKSLQTLKRKMK